MEVQCDEEDRAAVVWILILSLNVLFGASSSQGSTCKWILVLSTFRAAVYCMGLQRGTNGQGLTACDRSHKRASDHGVLRALHHRKIRNSTLYFLRHLDHS